MHVIAGCVPLIALGRTVVTAAAVQKNVSFFGVAGEKLVSERRRVLLLSLRVSGHFFFASPLMFPASC